MVSSGFYRLCFAVGSTALLAAIALGAAGALRSEGRLPGPSVDPLTLAQRAYKGRDPQRWIEEARTLTVIMPRNRRAFLMLGGALAAEGRIDPAIAAFERAQAIGGLPGLAHARLAALYAARGRASDAHAQVKLARAKGVTLSPEFVRELGPAPASP